VGVGEGVGEGVGVDPIGKVIVLSVPELSPPQPASANINRLEVAQSGSFRSITLSISAPQKLVWSDEGYAGNVDGIWMGTIFGNEVTWHAREKMLRCLLLGSDRHQLNDRHWAVCGRSAIGCWAVESGPSASAPITDIRCSLLEGSRGSKACLAEH
tara:strand:- start:5944 stop:6411 length:468 start_codon:yes stop_codon:yes gene_type:complete